MTAPTPTPGDDALKIAWERFVALHAVFERTRGWWTARTLSRVEALAAFAAGGDSEPDTIIAGRKALKLRRRREGWRLPGSRLMNAAALASMAGRSDPEPAIDALIRVRRALPRQTFGGDGRVAAALLLEDRSDRLEALPSMWRAVRRGLWASGRAHDAAYAALFVRQGLGPSAARDAIDAARAELPGFLKGKESPARLGALSPWRPDQYAERLERGQEAWRARRDLQGLSKPVLALFASSPEPVDDLIAELAQIYGLLRRLKPTPPKAHDILIAEGFRRAKNGADGEAAALLATLELALLTERQAAATAGAASAATTGAVIAHG